VAVPVPVPVPPPSAAQPAATPTEPSPAPNSAYSPPGSLEPTGRTDDRPSSYVTGANETWESVAQKNGVTVDKLKEMNPTVISPGSLPEGRPLRIR
jgi:LysM repeat protein